MRHAAPSILALDLGTMLGWALLAENKVISGTFDFTPAKDEKIGVRYVRLRREFLVNFRGVREVYFEIVRRHEGTHAAHVYGGFLAVVCAWCEENAIYYQGLEVAHIKQHVTGKGNANKQKMMAAMIKRGFAPADDNEADAQAILSLARKVRSL